MQRCVSVLDCVLGLFLLLGPALSVAADRYTQNAKGVTLTFLETKAPALAITTTLQNTLTQAVLMQAMQLEGVRYRYGGNAPETGFDCSGFVHYVFHQAAKIQLPRTTGGLSRMGQHVLPADLQAGDLVFFNTRNSANSHVGIYLGQGDFIHAPHAGQTVKIENMETGYWQQHYNGAQRIAEIATQ